MHLMSLFQRGVIALLLCLFSGCVSETRYSHLTIVEKSKKDQPAWIEMASNVFHKRNSRLAFVSSKEHVRDLTLGIWQARNQSILLSTMELYRKVYETASELAIEEKIILKSNAQLQSQIMEVLKKVVPLRVEIVDIYYETFINQSLHVPEKFEESTIYILCYFPLDGMREILDLLAASLQANPLPDLNKLSSVLKRSLG